MPTDKRTSIYRAAIDEFASHPYERASINRIVAATGIAKGSFYQYFEDKKDLFLYLLKVIGEEKAKYISPVMRNPGEHDVFTLLREIYLSGIQFARDYPKYAEIGKRLLKNKNSAVYKELLDDSLPTAYQIFETLLEKAIEKGEVRADIDIQLVAFLITSMNTLVVEYYFEYQAKNYDEAMMETIDKFLDFLKNGMAERTGPNTSSQASL